MSLPPITMNTIQSIDEKIAKSDYAIDSATDAGLDLSLPILQTGQEVRSLMEEYRLYNPEPIRDPAMFEEIMRRYALDPKQAVRMLPYGDRHNIGFETRRLYWWLAWNQKTASFRSPGELAPVSTDEAHKEAFPVTRIISFGDCNVACPYCKRDCQFVGDDGKPILALPIQLNEVGQLCEGAASRKEIIRFSGGDPVMFPKQTLALAEYFQKSRGAKVSIAHNGTGPAWVKKMLPYLSSAAIDIKGTPETIGEVMGIAPERGARMYDLSCETQGLVSHAGIPLNIRTPVFGHTQMEDLARIADDIRQVNDPRFTFWELRLYKPVDGIAWEAPHPEHIQEMAIKISQRIPDLWIGVRAKWNISGMLYIAGGKVVEVGEWGKDSVNKEQGSGNIRMDT